MKCTLLPRFLLVTSVLPLAGLALFGQEAAKSKLPEEQRLEESRVQGIPGRTHLPFQLSAIEQIRKILEEKASRTPAQLKLESHLHHAGQLARGILHTETMPSLANANAALEFDERGTVHVDIQGTVSAVLLAEIAALGGTVESSHPRYRAIRAWIPLLNVEPLANRSDVTFIRPADKGFHNSGSTIGSAPGLGRLPLAQREENVRRQLKATLPIVASDQEVRHRPNLGAITNAIVDTSGVVSEGADLVQALGITGNGIKVGVMSDGVMSVAFLQSLGDLPAVTVLSGQAGPPTGDEGTAMLEIVHDMAPGAQLFFATADTGAAQFATNIQSLAAAGCNIIVDDFTYNNEGVFQDGIIAQAVNTVTAGGVLYFSSAANSGNLDSGTSGTWEGDFNGAGGAITVINTAEGKTVTVHDFDSTHNFDLVTAASTSSSITTLEWSDPLGGSCNDYDLFVLDSALSTVLESSTTRQTCTQDPFEFVSAPAAGNVIVIVLFSGAARALHLATNRGRLSIGTDGNTFGHNAAATALTIAATPAQTTIFTSGNQSPETYSSDGPRKIFYKPDGTPVTPGNFLFATNGGTTLPKVDFTAPDCGQSAVAGFNPFCGTSAAAPHAASIAALMLSANPSLTPSVVKSAMSSTALPAHAGFNPRTVGAGIVMANLAVNAVLVPFVSLSPPSASFGTQPLTTSSAQGTVFLINAGLGSLTINSITIAGANSADFTISHNCPLSPSTLGGGSNCLLHPTFKPTAAGPRKSSISISDSAFGSPHTVILTGIGTAASLSPTTLPFASQTVGTPSTAQVITLTNKSGVTMNLWQIVILGTNAGDFSGTTTCSTTLGAGASCTASITFKPTATGARSASVLFSDDGGGSPQAVALTGTGM